MAQRPRALSQKTFGSRKSLEPMSITGLPAYFVQVVPWSRE